MDNFITLNKDLKISYRHNPGTYPGIIFFPGFMSNKTTRRSIFIEKYCRQKNINFMCFDYFGHGDSSGTKLDVTIGMCKQTANHILELLKPNKNILIGSSMGAWIMHLVAAENKDFISGMIGFSSAPDFTKHLMWDKFSEETKTTLLKDGIFYSPYYPITLKLIEEAKQHFILDRQFAFNFPIILLHGLDDDKVPPTYTTLLKKCHADKTPVETKFVAEATHSFDRTQDLLLVTAGIEQILALNF